MASALTLINEVITASPEEEKNHCSLNLEIKPQNTIRLFGCMIQEENPKLIELAIPDPLLLVQQITKKVLDKNNIVLKGTIVSSLSPDDAQFIAGFQSATLSQLVTHIGCR